MSEPIDDPIVIHSSATPAEVAAVVAAIAALRADLDPPRRRRSLWALPSRQVRHRLSPGVGAWRASTLPR